MTKTRSSFFVATLLLICLLSACASLPPTQEMSNARQALQAANEVGAAQIMASRTAHIQDLVHDAEKKLAVHQYIYARRDALKAKDEANRVRAVAWAISQAKTSIKNIPIANTALRKRLKHQLQDAIAAANRSDDRLAISMTDQIRAAARQASPLIQYETQ